MTNHDDDDYDAEGDTYYPGSLFTAVVIWGAMIALSTVHAIVTAPIYLPIFAWQKIKQIGKPKPVYLGTQRPITTIVEKPAKRSAHAR